jgi:hypothetical protein
VPREDREAERLRDEVRAVQPRGRQEPRRNGTPENVQKARQRNGIEGTISELKRMVKIGRLRVREGRMVETVNCIRLPGLNIRRCHGYRRASERLRKLAA